VRRFEADQATGSTAYLNNIFAWRFRAGKESQLVFDKENITDGLVDPLYWHSALLRQGEKMFEEGIVFWNHTHINTGHNCQADSFFMAGGDATAHMQILDIAPIAHDKTPEPHFFTQQFGQQEVTGVNRYTVYLCGIDHHGVHTRVNCRLEWRYK
jgi:hypothetical protein